MKDQIREGNAAKVSCLNEIYETTLQAASPFVTIESTEAASVSDEVNEALRCAGVSRKRVEEIQELIADLEGISHKEGFMSGFKYAMRLFAECV